ncbi:hypothetical protein I4U23_016365 [Adineta vaga]|nr:hypothetical protein I4U23_016365 [Adineta vaga]
MDEIFSLDILYVDEYIPEQLCQLVQNGLCSQLDTRLYELSNSAEYLTALTWHYGEQLSLLMSATLNGYDDIVRVLLTHCDSKLQIELKGQLILYDETLVKGVTALYCACYRGHFTVAKTLIEFGQANVSQETERHPYYPLFLHATVMNRQDIIHFLLENKYADINETKSNDSDESSALILAVRQNRTSLVKYLIDNGADINYCNRNRTSREILRLLYNAGANINIKYNTGDTLFMRAAKYNKDLELAACYLFDISSSIENINVVFNLLRTALQQRQLLHIEKISIEPMYIYNNQQECQTIDELDRIKNDRNRIFIEISLMRERIYASKKNIKIIEFLNDYGDQLANKKEYNKSPAVYIRRFNFYQQTEMRNNLANFVWLFCKMLTNNRIISIHDFLQVCYLTFELKNKEDRDLTIYNALFLVIISTKIFEQKRITKEEQISIYSWIKDLCRHQLTTQNGQTLLHLCVDRNTNDSLNFRSKDTIRQINHWLDFNTTEPIHYDTPLHTICKRDQNKKIIKLLLNSGCHMDCVNKSGKIPLDYINDKKIQTLFTTPFPLKCLCARIIVNKSFYTTILNTLTSTLKKFIFLHDSLHIDLILK